ncbi:MAG: hypothetical protein ACLR8Y_17325 [Alistipes indistinctus]
MTYRLEEIASITGSTLTGRDCRIERVITDSRNPYDPARNAVRCDTGQPPRRTCLHPQPVRWRRPRIPDR